MGDEFSDEHSALKVSDNGRSSTLSEKLNESSLPDAGGNGLINLRRRGTRLAMRDHFDCGLRRDRSFGNFFARGQHYYLNR